MAIYNAFFLENYQFTSCLLLDVNGLPGFVFLPLPHTWRGTIRSQCVFCKVPQLTESKNKHFFGSLSHEDVFCFISSTKASLKNQIKDGNGGLSVRYMYKYFLFQHAVIAACCHEQI